jgi:hypothetical protein
VLLVVAAHTTILRYSLTDIRRTRKCLTRFVLSESYLVVPWCVNISLFLTLSMIRRWLGVGSSAARGAAYPMIRRFSAKKMRRSCVQIL